MTNNSYLKITSGHRRRAVANVWTCHHCKRTFASEKVFMNHTCKQKRRAEEIKTVKGQAAYHYYLDWLRAKRWAAQSIDAFITSQFYLAFNSFTEHVIKLKIDKPDLYIRLMVRRDISPVMWCNNAAYCVYLEHSEKESDPFELFARSIEALERVALAENVKLSNVFTHLGVKRVLEMIKLRHLSAWLILHSDRFFDFLNELDEDDARLITGAVNVHFWVDYLADKQELRSELRDVVKDFKL